MTSDPKSGTMGEAWEESYRRRENFVFSPAEEVVRFFSRYLRKRIGLEEFRDIRSGITGARILDAGCGIGRNLVYGQAMGLSMWGVDLSQHAVDTARRWLNASAAFDDASARVIQGDLRRLPWEPSFFDHAISDSALDSMAGEIASEAIAEIARVLKPGGLFYCNLISGIQGGSSAEFVGDRMVETSHEKGTVQCYYNMERIHDLFDAAFDFEELILVRREDMVGGVTAGRWHTVLRRK